jgi:thymidine phosphorylase
VGAHGGDASVLDDLPRLDRAAHQAVIEAPASGFVTRCDAHTIGIAATRLGAGRERKEDDIDHGVGITLRAKIGDRVEAGEPLAEVRYDDEENWHAQRERLASAWVVADTAPAPAKLILERIDSSQI